MTIPNKKTFPPKSAKTFSRLLTILPKVILDALRYRRADYQLAQPELPASLMRFTLIDRIVELQPGVRITATKSLTMAEEYLMDHFPRFPVMPGVLMLESMTQVGAWLVRATEDFAHSMVVLKEANNVKYGQFVEPGQTLVVSAEVLSQDEEETKLKATGRVDGQITVSARLVLQRYNLAGRTPQGEATDRMVKQELRHMFRLLYRPASIAQTSEEHATAVPGGNGQAAKK